MDGGSLAAPAGGSPDDPDYGSEPTDRVTVSLNLRFQHVTPLTGTQPESQTGSDHLFKRTKQLLGERNLIPRLTL